MKRNHILVNLPQFKPVLFKGPWIQVLQVIDRVSWVWLSSLRTQIIETSKSSIWNACKIFHEKWTWKGLYSKLTHLLYPCKIIRPILMKPTFLWDYFWSNRGKILLHGNTKHCLWWILQYYVFFDFMKTNFYLCKL